MSTVTGGRRAAQHRNPLTDPSRPPAPGYVRLLRTLHGLFVAWCWPPLPAGPVACPRACECDLCGVADGSLAPMIHATARGRIDAHPDCGAARGYVPDPDDVPRCRFGPGCESCGAVDDLLVVVVDPLPGAATCVTLCASCEAAGDRPAWSSVTALARAGEHWGHVGHTVDPTVGGAR